MSSDLAPCNVRSRIETLLHTVDYQARQLQMQRVEAAMRARQGNLLHELTALGKVIVVLAGSPPRVRTPNTGPS